jgi:hypothetical protein
MIRPDQMDWVVNLPLTEFAINSCISETTKFSPFELNYGFTPAFMHNFAALATAPGVRAFGENARNALEEAHNAIIASCVRQTHHANKKCAPHAEYKVGDKVYLSMENLQLLPHRARKLGPKFIGPFLVVEAHNQATVVRLDLPEELS